MCVPDARAALSLGAFNSSRDMVSHVKKLGKIQREQLFLMHSTMVIDRW